MARALSDQEHHASEQDQEGQDLKRCNESVVPRNAAEHAVASGQSVHDDFQHFKVDDHKSDVNQDVEDASDGACRHLALTQGDAGHGLPAEWGLVRKISIPSEADGLSNEANPLCEQRDRNNEQQGEQHDTQHRWSVSGFYIGAATAHSSASRASICSSIRSRNRLISFSDSFFSFFLEKTETFT